MNNNNNAPGTLYGLGVGPGDPELLTLKALRILRAVTVLAYPAPSEGDSLARAIAAPHLPDGQIEIAIRMPLDAKQFPAEDVYGPAAREIAEHLQAGRDVAALCEGDPFFYGSFMYLFERLAGEHKIEVVPGVSSPMACAAALATPLAARNDVLSVLPAPLDEDSLTARLEVCDAAAIVKVGRHIAKVRRILQNLDLETRARYIERASLPAERILPLSQAPDPAPYFSMVLVHRRGEAWK
ncbi:MAG: precorrin-2 C(20)-methyltransferase [Rhodospirillaceae bacterium]|nr:precorrin-2 C(20)-methyltransferase [Rhodospirillaceae bacterium]MBT4425324.1 precorrin-2 C(20)-methyltransferase [Rhodospirillaceae bacterium]MBT5676731.1 precorrin-2 C(20)-methyltransferase [Rhodospirillaceae bacterium]MBT6829834.1 precorrin-2 C(20)-methyltransferase [Rhodospirillaceae bacterium]MBT7292868.1 precorrin-2 C(20)-methyltransferase [Rhodospirillaceae bacterium]